MHTAHADDAQNLRAVCKRDKQPYITRATKSPEPALAIVGTLILLNGGTFPVELINDLKPEASVFPIPFRLGVVPPEVMAPPVD